LHLLRTKRKLRKIARVWISKSDLHYGKEVKEQSDIDAGIIPEDILSDERY